MLGRNDFEFLAKSVRVSVCGALQVFREDPGFFFEKCLRRLREVTTNLGRRIGLSTVVFNRNLNPVLGRITKADKSDFSEKDLAQKLLLRRPHEGYRDFVDSRPLTSQAARIRVLYYANNSVPYTYSGYTERTHYLAKALHRQDIDITVATRLAYPLTAGKIALRETRIVDDVEYRLVVPWNLPSDQRKRDDLAVDLLIRLGREARATILHTTSDYRNALIVSRAAAALDVPWVYEVRGEPESTWLSKFPPDERWRGEDSRFYKQSRTLEAEAMKAAAKVVALSEVSKRSLVERGIEDSKIVVIPNGIESTQIGRSVDSAELRNSLGLGDARTIGVISSLVEYEGINILLEALVWHPDLRCLIVGDGESFSSLVALARNLGIHDQVIFTGRVPSSEVSQYYAVLDLLVVPRIDSDVTRRVTPIKTLKAMALGIPVLASDTPALREVTGGLATYFAPGDPSDLAMALEKVFKAPRENQADADSVRNFLEARTWDSNAKKLIRLYRGETFTQSC